MPYSHLSYCARCGAKNMVPAANLAHRGNCSGCKSELAPVSEPIDVNDADFDDIIDRSNVPILVDFWAPWCAPCKTAAAEVRKVAADMQGRALVLKVDTDTSPLLVARFGVQSIPNLMIFNDGIPAFSRPGFARREEMRTWIEDFLTLGSRSQRASF